MLPFKTKFTNVTPNVPVVLDRNHPLSHGLVGAWIFDGPKANISRDYSGNGKHGDWVNGSGSISKSASKYGLNFRHTGGANSDRINLGSTGTDTPVALAGSNTFTIVAKTFRDSSLSEDAFPRVVDRSDGGSAANGWGIWFNTSLNHCQFNVDDGSVASYLSPGSSSSKDVWETWAFVASGDLTSVSNTQWFKDGSPVTTTIGTAGTNTVLSSSTVDMAIAGWNHTTGRHMSGDIDFIYIYDRALSDGEIQSLNADPYQIFKPAVERVYFTASAVGGIVNIASGTFTTTGGVVTLPVDSVVNVDSGSITLTGGGITTPTAKVLGVDSGNFSLDGGAISTPLSLTLNVDSGSFNLTGGSITLPIGSGVDIASGTFTTAGGAISLPTNTVINVDSGNFSVVGGGVSLSGVTTIKYYDGSVWVSKPLKIFNGTSYESPLLFRWTGSIWDQI